MSEDCEHNFCFNNYIFSGDIKEIIRRVEQIARISEEKDIDSKSLREDWGEFRCSKCGENRIKKLTEDRDRGENKMFDVRGDDCWFWVSEGKCNYLHSDGSILSTVEYWPTRGQAQAVLDKYRPKHEWKHGDVFRTRQGIEMIYFKYCSDRKPEAYCLNWMCGGPSSNLENDLLGATFLFNIGIKILEWEQQEG